MSSVALQCVQDPIKRMLRPHSGHSTVFTAPVVWMIREVRPTKVIKPELIIGWGCELPHRPKHPGQRIHVTQVQIRNQKHVNQIDAQAHGQHRPPLRLVCFHPKVTAVSWVGGLKQLLRAYSVEE